MIKFFRHIRLNLMETGKTTKYFKYAIGEIILVVIGILIALQINNWNEQKNKEAKIVNILKEIQSDIITDIKTSKIIFEYQLHTDSITKNILNNKYSVEDYKNSRIPRIGYNYRDFKIVTNGFDNLKNAIDNVPKKYAHLLPDIKNLYVMLKTDIDVANEKLRTTVFKNVDDDSQKAWTQEVIKGRTSDEAIEYYRNNIEYKNLVANYMNYRSNIFALSNEYRVTAIDLYVKIHDAIGDKSDVPDIVSYTIKDDTLLNDYLGTYILKETLSDAGVFLESIQILKRDGILLLIRNGLNENKLRFYDTNIFYGEENRSFYIFNRNKKGQLYINFAANVSAIYEKSATK